MKLLSVIFLTYKKEIPCNPSLSMVGLVCLLTIQHYSLESLCHRQGAEGVRQSILLISQAKGQSTFAPYGPNGMLHSLEG